MVCKGEDGLREEQGPGWLDDLGIVRRLHSKPNTQQASSRRNPRGHRWRSGRGSRTGPGAGAGSPDGHRTTHSDGRGGAGSGGSRFQRSHSLPSGVQ